MYAFVATTLRGPAALGKRIAVTYTGATVVRWTGVLLCALFGVLTPRAVAQDDVRRALVHITVEEGGLGYRARETLSFGVPLPRGVLRGPERLRCWRDNDNSALPVQASALSRWPDGSLRWALIDTQLELQAREQVSLVVGIADDIPPNPDPWQFEAGEDRRNPIGGTVSDGRTTWRLVNRGEESDTVLGLRPRLLDVLGHFYGARVDLDSIRILERGALRLTIEVSGEHRAQAPEGLPVAFHTFTARVHLLAGTGRARVEWTLQNGPLHDPTGPLAFLSYELLMDVGAGPHGIEVPGSPVHDDVRFVLSQNGPSREQADYNVNGKHLAVITQQDLWAGVDSPDGGVYVHRRDSANNHPAAVSYEPGDALHVGLLPERPGNGYWLDDAQQKTFRLTIARGVGKAGRSMMMNAARPAHVSLDPRDVAASGAWGDTGIMYVPDLAEMRTDVWRPRNPATGWTDWGEFHSTNTHTTGSPRNRLSVYLEAIQSGRTDLYEMARARAWHAMDLRPYHILGFRADEFPSANLHEGLPHGNEPPQNRLGRTGIDSRYIEYKRDLPTRGHGYNGFDPEHMTLDDVYECYLLTGDRVALDALRSAGEAMLTWRSVMSGGELHTGRSTGWTLRALVQVHRATGDRRYLDAAADMVARADAGRGRGEVKYLHRNRPDARHIAESESEAPWMVAIAIQGLAAYYAETADPAVPPMLRDLVSFIMASYRGERGFADALPVDGPLTGGTTNSPLGVSQWVPGALAEAAFITGDHAPVDRAYAYYRVIRLHPTYGLSFGSKTWPFWQAYLQSLRERHGDAAVRSVSTFRMPKPEPR
jgi:hypothetical protein